MPLGGQRLGLMLRDVKHTWHSAAVTFLRVLRSSAFTRLACRSRAQILREGQLQPKKREVFNIVKLAMSFSRSRWGVTRSCESRSWQSARGSHKVRRCPSQRRGDNCHAHEFNLKLQPASGELPVGVYMAPPCSFSFKLANVRQARKLSRS